MCIYFLVISSAQGAESLALRNINATTIVVIVILIFIVGMRVFQGLWTISYLFILRLNRLCSPLNTLPGHYLIKIFCSGREQWRL